MILYNDQWYDSGIQTDYIPGGVRTHDHSKLAWAYVIDTKQDCHCLGHQNHTWIIPI